MNKENSPQILVDFMKLSNDLYQKEKIRENIAKDQKVIYIREELELLSRVEYLFQIIYQDRKHFSNHFEDIEARKHFLKTLKSIKKLVGKIILKKKCALREGLEREIELLRTNNYDKRGIRGNIFLRFAISSFTLITIFLASSSAFADKYKFVDGSETIYSQKDAKDFVQSSIDRYGAQTFLEILNMDLDNLPSEVDKEEVRFIQTMANSAKSIDSDGEPRYDLTFEQRNKLTNLISGQVYHNQEGPLDSNELSNIKGAIGFNSQKNFSIKKSFYDTKLQQVIDKNLVFFIEKFQNSLK